MATGMGDHDPLTAPPSLSTQPTRGLPGARCACGCGTMATRASGYVWAYRCDPTIDAAEKRAAFQLGGRRGQMTPAEVAALLEDADDKIKSHDGRHDLRARLMLARGGSRINGPLLRDLLAVVDSAAKDDGARPVQAPDRAAPVVVEVQRFGENRATA